MTPPERSSAATLPAFAWFGWWMKDEDGALVACCRIEEPCDVHGIEADQINGVEGNWFDHPDCRIPVGAQDAE